MAGAATAALPLDEKAKRTRDLLASFYNTDAAESDGTVGAGGKSQVLESHQDSINGPSFDPDAYMKILVQKSNLEGLLQKHVQMASEIKNLDTDLQMLVYENYNKFISATDTIKRMKNNIVGMETNMEELLVKITSVQSRSDTVNTSLFTKRDRIEKLHRTRNLLRKVQFIYDLPSRLNKCIKAEAYGDAVRFFTGARPIFEAYGDSSFQDCKKASEEAIDIVIQKLQAKLCADTEPIESRAEAVMLLKQLNFPVTNVKSSLLEKLQGSLLKYEDGSTEGTIVDISNTFRSYIIIFPDMEHQLTELAQAFFSRRCEEVQQHVERKMSSADLLLMIRAIWEDTSVMDEVLPEAALPIFSLEAAQSIMKQHIATSFTRLHHEITDALLEVQLESIKDSSVSPLQVALEASKTALLQGSMDLILEFHRFLEDGLELVTKLKDLIIDWVQEGFQEFFQKLDGHFLMLSGKGDTISQDHDTKNLEIDKVPTGLILVLAQLCIFIEQIAIPKITEEIAAYFSGGGIRGYENGPAFVPAEICRLFRLCGDKLLHLYVSLKVQKISVILKKRFTTPNWIKHKEPREVHMFVDLLLQELEDVVLEGRQTLPSGLMKRHRHSDSSGSTNSSRGNPVREDKLMHSDTQRARSQFLETHLAKLFQQKMEIFTKLEYTQESVISSIIKLCLKSFQEFVRLQTFNRSGYQQIQLDIEFLKSPLKDLVDDGAVIDFLLKEVHGAAHERCLDPIPLEPPILDKLIAAKLAKSKE